METQENYGDIKELFDRMDRLMNEASRTLPNQSAELNELYTALSKAQGAIENATKNVQNTFFKSKYADLSAVINVSKEPLSSNGLCVMQFVRKSMLVTRLAHCSGQWIESEIEIKPDKGDIQSLGKYISYIRRYVLSALLCIAQEDDDAESCMKRQKVISDEEIAQINDELEGVEDILPVILKGFKAKSLKDIPSEKVAGIIARIRDIKKNREIEQYGNSGELEEENESN